MAGSGSGPAWQVSPWGIAHRLAGPADIRQTLGEFQLWELTTFFLVLLGHRHGLSGLRDVS